MVASFGRGPLCHRRNEGLRRLAESTWYLRRKSHGLDYNVAQVCKYSEQDEREERVVGQFLPEAPSFFKLVSVYLQGLKLHSSAQRSGKLARVCDTKDTSKPSLTEPGTYSQFPMLLPTAPCICAF